MPARASRAAVLITLAVAVAACAERRAPAVTHLVTMTEQGQYGLAFSPQRVSAHPGDTLRFVQDGVLPHNVHFRSAPPGVLLESLPESPMLQARGATWDLVLDARFPVGKYFFVCTPHEVMGMAGILYLREPEAEGDSADT